MATYWELLSPELRQEQEDVRPSIQLNLGQLRKKRKKRQQPQTRLTPYQKLANKAHLLGAGQRQGFEAEERFTRIFLQFIAERRSPSWVVGVDHPTREEEVEYKADRVVLTKDQRRLPVQIKSSFLGKLRFKAKHGALGVPCVVVDSCELDVVIFWVAIDELCIAREVSLRQRAA